VSSELDKGSISFAQIIIDAISNGGPLKVKFTTIHGDNLQSRMENALSEDDRGNDREVLGAVSDVVVHIVGTRMSWHLVFENVLRKYSVVQLCQYRRPTATVLQSATRASQDFQSFPGLVQEFNLFWTSLIVPATRIVRTLM